MAGVVRLGDLAARVGGRVEGDADRPVRGVATLDRAGPDDLAFLTNPRYRSAAETTGAGAVLVGPGVSLPGKDLLVADDPYRALAEILELFYPEPPVDAGVSPLASVAGSARVGEGVTIGPFAVLEDDVRIGAGSKIGSGCHVGRESTVGERTVLHPRVVLYARTRVGDRCILHAGVVLGADGFGFATTAEGHRKVPQLGRVVVEDDVEIGANSTVDRGTLDDTVIGRGTKIDDLVMVAHGVRVGPDCLLVAQSGIAGSTKLGSRVTVAGQSGAAGHLTLGDGVVVAAKSAVFQDVPAGTYVAGVPAIDLRAWRRSAAATKSLPELRARVRRLEEQLQELQRRTDGEGRR